VAVGGTVGSLGLVLRSTDGGVHWTTEPVPTSTYALSSISCASASFCVAVVRNAQAYVQVIATSDGGLHWHAQDVDPNADLSDLETVRCFSSSHCVATGNGASDEATVIATTNGGATWRAISGFGPTQQIGIEGVYCSSALSCLVTGWESQGNASVGVASRTTDGGLTWTDETVPSNAEVLWDVACTSPGVCWSPAQIATGSEILSTTDDGMTWAVQAIASGASPIFISCPAALTCYASGYQRTVFNTNVGLLLSTVNGGSTWTNVALPPSSADATDVSCPSATTCVIGGQTDNGVPQLYVAASGVATLDTVSVTGVTYVDSLSCGSVTRCVAAGVFESPNGREGTTLSTTNAGISWAAHAMRAGTTTMQSVSCPNASTCVAVGALNNYQASVIERSSDGGASWQVSTAGGFGLTSVSCATASTCVAVGSSDLYLAPGTKGRWRTGTAPSKVAELDEVACPTATECVAVALLQDLSTSIFVRTGDGGRSWQVTAGPRGQVQYSSVQCVSASHCVAAGTSLDQYGNAGSGVLDVTSDGGRSWRAAVVPASTPAIDGAACLNATTCFAAGTSDTSGVLLRSSDAGAHWGYAGPPANADSFAGMTCGKSGCWVIAVTSAGTTELDAAR
jgi:hypothetical protein